MRNCSEATRKMRAASGVDKLGGRVDVGAKCLSFVGEVGGVPFSPGYSPITALYGQGPQLAHLGLLLVYRKKRHVPGCVAST